MKQPQNCFGCLVKTAKDSGVCLGRLKMRKLQDMKMRDQFAGVENAEKVSMESQSVKKCLKDIVVVIAKFH